MNGALHDRLAQVTYGIHASGASELVPGMIEVEEHHDSGLRIEPRESDETDPDRWAGVVAQKVEECTSSHE